MALHTSCLICWLPTPWVPKKSFNQLLVAHVGWEMWKLAIIELVNLKYFHFNYLDIKNYL